MHVSELPHADAAAPNSHLMLMAEQPQAPHSHAHHHLARPQSVTPLEVGMYVLLAVFGAAIVIFAASYVVYTWSVRGGKPLLPPATHSRRLSHHDMNNQDPNPITNAHDWVWLGRATLERASGIGISPPSASSGSSSDPLSDLNGNSQQQHQQHQVGTEMEERGRSCYNHNLSHINITANPGAEEMEEEVPPPPYNLSGSTTFTRPNRGQRRVTFNNLSDEGASSSEEERPPIPPHRNIGVSTNTSLSLDSRPPPIPPHGVNVISNPLEEGHPIRHPNDYPQNQIRHAYTQPQQNQPHPTLPTQNPSTHTIEKTLPDPKFVEVNADDFVRLRGVCRGRAGQVRRATILENPLLSSHLPDNFSITDHMDNLPPSMDYDQLMEYFSNLKESNA